MAETSSLLNCRTGNRTGGSNPPSSAMVPSATRRFRLAARTHASHAWNTSSILVGATKKRNLPKKEIPFLVTRVFYLSRIIAFSNYYPVVIKNFVELAIKSQAILTLLTKIRRIRKKHKRTYA